MGVKLGSAIVERQSNNYRSWGVAFLGLHKLIGAVAARPNARLLSGDF